MKSEPDEFSIDDLRKAKIAAWDGVRNYRARNYLRAMRQGDLALFYHSSIAVPEVAGLMKVIKEAELDPSQFDPKSPYHDPGASKAAPRWNQVRVKFVKAFSRRLPLPELRRQAALRNMILLRHSRLSVTPVTAAEFRNILNLCR